MCVGIREFIGLCRAKWFPGTHDGHGKNGCVREPGAEKERTLLPMCIVGNGFICVYNKFFH